MWGIDGLVPGTVHQLISSRNNVTSVTEPIRDFSGKWSSCCQSCEHWEYQRGPHLARMTVMKIVQRNMRQVGKEIVALWGPTALYYTCDWALPERLKSSLIQFQLLSDVRKAGRLIEARLEQHVLRGHRQSLAEHTPQLSNSDPAIRTTLSVIGGAVDSRGVVWLSVHRSDPNAKKWKYVACRIHCASSKK